jgi:predicted RNase H-like HicB family nuclease
MKLEWTVVFESQPDGWIIASVPEVPGVMSQGRTMEEAREMLADALEQLSLARREAALAEALPERQTEPLAVEVGGLP